MTPRTCSSVRRRLSLYVDGELGVREQFAVGAHLRECAGCAAEERSLREVGDHLRSWLPSAAEMESGALDGLASTVVSRVRAEREESVTRRVGRVFEDVHLLWAAVGAAGATVGCLLLMVGMLHVGVQARADSLSGLLTALGSPGSNSNPVSPSGWVRPPRVMEDQLDPPVIDSEDEAVFALYTVVTREGSISHLTMLQSASEANRQQVIDLLDTIARARFEPARYGNSRSTVAVKCIMLFTQLTVRGKMPAESSLAPAVGPPMPLVPPAIAMPVASVATA